MDLHQRGHGNTGTVLAEGRMSSDRKHDTESTWIAVTLEFRLTMLVSVCVSVASPGRGELFGADVLL